MFQHLLMASSPKTGKKVFKPRRARRGRDPMADMNARLAKVELAIADRIDLFEEVGQSIEKLEVAQEELRGEMQGALNKVAESCASQGKDLKDSLASEVDAVRRNVASLREG